MSDSLSQLCANLCMTKPLTRGGGLKGCCGCGCRDDGILEEVEREQRRTKSTQPTEKKSMAVTPTDESHDYRHSHKGQAERSDIQRNSVENDATK